ncbi:MAG: hypothetical protein HYR56_12815 [Acidobacteria bacterium]|nr:hypothetical protein [Acidobacteriota bacterium]MBI3424247.1 hypothetical protein [Acidobacteriota bacterium]
MLNTPPPPKFSRDILLGLGLTLLLHLIQLPLAFLSGGVSFVLIGFSQGLYIVPAIVVAGVKQRPGMMIGLMIGAALTFLLNAATCMGLLYAFTPKH